MSAFLSANLSTIIVAGILGLIVGAIVADLYKKRKAGISSCGGSCGGCSMNCHDKNEPR